MIMIRDLTCTDCTPYTEPILTQNSEVNWSAFIYVFVLYGFLLKNKLLPLVHFIFVSEQQSL